MIGWIEQCRKWLRWRNSIGGRGERAAARHLRRSGYRVLARNLRNRFGEIDLVVEDRRRNRQIVVVEVKTTSAEDPPPEVHLNRAKQRKLSGLAGLLVRRYRLHDRAVRFDLIAIVWPPGARRPSRLTHYENAFESCY